MRGYIEHTSYAPTERERRVREATRARNLAVAELDLAAAKLDLARVRIGALLSNTVGAQHERARNALAEVDLLRSRVRDLAETLEA